MPIQGRYIWNWPIDRPKPDYEIFPQDAYYIRELPDERVVWVGEHIPLLLKPPRTDPPTPPNPPTQPDFTNVFLGRRIRGWLRGDLIDVPKGKANSVLKNVLVEHLVPDPPAPVPFIYFNLPSPGRRMYPGTPPDYKLLPSLGYRRLDRDTLFGGSAERHEWLSGFGEPAPPYLTGDYLTGVWHCDDGGTYYVHQYGLHVVWFGEHPTPTGGANVFFGNRIEGTTVDGEWFDVPKGSGVALGLLRLNVVSPTRLEYAHDNGGFGGRVWTRV